MRRQAEPDLSWKQHPDRTKGPPEPHSPPPPGVQEVDPPSAAQAAPQRVRIFRRTARPDVHEDLRRVRWLAELLDTRFSIAGFRFGLDGLVGLIPGVGDTLTMLAALYPLYIASKHNIALPIRARMAGNVLLDWLIGLVPLLGDIFDFAFKANKRNLNLLQRAIDRRENRR